MASGQVPTVLRCLHELLRRAPTADGSDAHLLERFVATRDEAAFACLLQRHGPMVLGVCRRVLRHAEDAEDAFQATFLILARKAAKLRRRELLGPWLYGVASRTAARARVDLARRRHREQQAVPRAAEAPDEGLLWRDLRPVLDEEVGLLPERYRVPFVLCYLQGLTNKEAARALGCPEGTILSRLAWARARLRARLTRRGVTLSAGTMSAALASGVAGAAVHVELVAATVGAMGGVAAGPIPAHVARLTEEVLRAMWLTKVKVTVALALVLATIGFGLEALYPAAAQESPQPPVPAAAAPAPAAANSPRDAARAPQAHLAKPKDADPVGFGGAKGKARDEVTKGLIPVLVEALKDKDQQIFITAEQTLRGLGRPAVPAVSSLLDSKDATLRRSAIRILGGMGVEVDEAVAALNRHFLDEKALAEALRDRDEVVQTVAQATVVRLGKTGVPALVRMAEGKDAQLRAMALIFLGEMRGKALEAVPALTRLFQTADAPEERRAALTAINSIVVASPSDRPSRPRPGKSPRGGGAKPNTLP